MKLKTPTRANFSRSGKLCDQTFYHDSQPCQRPLEQITKEVPVTRKTSTSGFSSISRQKRGNFRFPIRLPHGQFSQHPNHSFGKSRSPSWSFSKTERYKKNKFIEFEVCEKNPLLADNQDLKMRASCTSMREILKDEQKMNRTSIHISTNFKSKETDGSMKETKTTRNYSIVSPRDTSSIGFYAQSKIKKPRYLSKQDLKRAEGELDQYHYQQQLKPSHNGYIQFSKRRARHPNRNSKGFETVLYPYDHQKQFNNYSQTQYPTGIIGHIDMDQHLDRPTPYTERLGPNMSNPYPFQYARKDDSKINLNLKTFRDQIRTRYDRVGPQPNTRLDYDSKAQALSGLLEMNRMLGRNPDFFPIIDPAIKKAGDQQMKEALKMHIPNPEINQAHRPKNVQNYGLMLQKAQ